MNSFQESKLSMYEAVYSFLLSNPVILALIPYSSQFMTFMNTVITNLKSYKKQQEDSIKGVTEGKQRARDILEDKTLDIALKTRAYAIITKNDDLRKSVKVTKWQLKKCADTTLESTAQNIHDHANQYVASLAQFGITAAVLTDFQTSINDFSTLIPAPRQKIVDREKFTKEIKKLFVQGDEALDAADAMAEVIHKSNPDFFTAYMDIRKIVETGTRKIDFKGTAIALPTGKPLQGVTFKLTLLNPPPDGRFEITKRTSVKGNFVIKTMLEGNYTLTVSCPGYTSQQLSTSHIKGIVTRVAVQMQPTQ